MAFGDGMVWNARQDWPRGFWRAFFAFLPCENKVGLAGFAIGNGSGFIQSQPVESALLKRTCRPLDQNAIAWVAAAMPLTMLTGGGNDQGARAADNEHNQRGIYGFHPRAAQKQRGE